MNIIEILVEGGILFMGTLTIFLIAVVITSILAFTSKSDKWLKRTQELALFAFVFGIFGQVIGLFGAFQGIERMGEVSQEILAGGLKVSSYTTIYGFIIFLLAKAVKIAFNFINK
jgi:biopolymer transport protein ExbB/TolQ